MTANHLGDIAEHDRQRGLEKVRYRIIISNFCWITLERAHGPVLESESLRALNALTRDALYTHRILRVRLRYLHARCAVRNEIMSKLTQADIRVESAKKILQNIERYERQDEAKFLTRIWPVCTPAGRLRFEFLLWWRSQ